MAGDVVTGSKDDRDRMLATPHLTLSRHTVLDVRSRAEVERADLAVFREALRRSILRAGVDAHMRLAVVDLDCIRVAAVECSEHRVTLDDPGNVALLRPVQGSFEVQRGKRTIRVEPGQSLLLDIGERTTSVSPDYHGLQALLPQALLAETLAAMMRTEAPSRLGDRTLDWTQAAVACMDSFLLTLVDGLSTGGGPLSASRPARLGASRALLALVAAAVIEDSPPEPMAAPWQVRRAEELLRACACEPVNITDICRELQVGARAL